MKITRNEFKELVELAKDVNKNALDAMKYVQDDVVCDIAFPVLRWISEKLDLSDEYGDLLDDLADGEEIGFDAGDNVIEMDNGVTLQGITYTKDLDVLYDILLTDHAEV